MLKNKTKIRILCAAWLECAKIFFKISSSFCSASTYFLAFFSYLIRCIANRVLISSSISIMTLIIKTQRICIGHISTRRISQHRRTHHVIINALAADATSSSDFSEDLPLAESPRLAAVLQRLPAQHNTSITNETPAYSKLKEYVYQSDMHYFVHNSLSLHAVLLLYNLVDVIVIVSDCEECFHCNGQYAHSHTEEECILSQETLIYFYNSNNLIHTLHSTRSAES